MEDFNAGAGVGVVVVVVVEEEGSDGMVVGKKMGAILICRDNTSCQY